MNNFIFENATKAVFGQGCVKEYLSCMVSHYGPNVLLAYGGGSIKRNGIYDEVCGILQSTDKNIVEFSGIMPNPHLRQGAGGSQTGARQSHRPDPGSGRRLRDGLLQGGVYGRPV